MTEKNEVPKPNARLLTKSLFIIIFCTVFAIFLPIGYNLGVINTPAEHIKKWFNDTLVQQYNSPLSVSDMEIAWAFVVSIYLIGAAIASLGGSWVANRFGRKPGIITSAVFFIISAIFYITCRLANSIEMLLIGRLLSGFGAGLSTAIGSMYLAEMAPLGLRGSSATCISMGITGGILLAQAFSIEELLGSDTLWEYALSIYVIFVILSLIPILWFPESPKFLYVILGEKEKARDTLKRLRGANSTLIDEEIQMMEVETIKESERRSIWSILKDPLLRLPVLLILLTPLCMQMSGLNAVFFYSVSIFDKIGLGDEGQWATLAIGAINFAIVAMSPIVMSRINRRPLLLFSTFFSIVFLVILTVIIHFIDHVDWFPYASIAAIVFFIASVQFGLGPISYFIGSELFESGSRPAAMALGSFTSYLGNTVVGMVFPSMQLAWGAFAFIPFAVILFIFLMFIIPYMPETRGRTTAEVATLLSNGLRSKPLKKL